MPLGHDTIEIAPATTRVKIARRRTGKSSTRQSTRARGTKSQGNEDSTDRDKEVQVDEQDETRRGSDGPGGDADERLVTEEHDDDDYDEDEHDDDDNGDDDEHEGDEAERWRRLGERPPPAPLAVTRGDAATTEEAASGLLESDSTPMTDRPHSHPLPMATATNEECKEGDADEAPASATQVAALAAALQQLPTAVTVLQAQVAIAPGVQQRSQGEERDPSPGEPRDEERSEDEQRQQERGPRSESQRRREEQQRSSAVQMTVALARVDEEGTRVSAPKPVMAAMPTAVQQLMDMVANLQVGARRERRPAPLPGRHVKIKELTFQLVAVLALGMDMGEALQHLILGARRFDSSPISSLYVAASSGIPVST
ncbi:unnamed protein product [Phytophthora fragariaefolia]|uniref:Unnamed protein product n=1 Tax=Phytophthora fragariaefolia TaxID=1490495 RepID=A0A9W6U673_9STRA|nr:unnamed protein product [Phytophthora fragariaefolia]